MYKVSFEREHSWGGGTDLRWGESVQEPDDFQNVISTFVIPCLQIHFW